MRRFLARHAGDLPSFLRSMTAGRFGVALVVVTLPALLVTWRAARSRPREGWLVAAIAFQVVMAANAFQHAGAAIWARGYAPGVVTGLVLCLPDAVYILRRVLREEWVTGRQLLLAARAMVALSVPFLIGLDVLVTLR